MKKTRNGISMETLLLSQEISKTRMSQVITSGLLLAVLVIQIYLFVSVNQVLQSAMATF
ncbi:hypothetical protein K9M41_02800 [Candidatus Gracilibacteria bacterium]|nr:hypothetical protein [Candidatus Gracilibacteria bacterium]